MTPERLAAAIEAGEFTRENGFKKYSDLWAASVAAGLSQEHVSDVIQAHHSGRAAAIVRALIAKEGKE